jgi:4a-hydroxytetrahydrobiopterin dehydratase
MIEAEHKGEAPLRGERVSELARKSCVPCKGGTPPLTTTEIAPFIGQVKGWAVEREHHLRKTFHFKDFKATLEFVNRVGAIAEQEGHHPDISFGWGKATIEIWTHKIDGLTESDFILAAKIDESVLSVAGYRPPA